MTLCDGGHDEVCYEVRNCPVCDKMEDIRDLEAKIEELEETIEELQEKD